MKPCSDLAIEHAVGDLIVLDKAVGHFHQLDSSASFVWTCLGEALPNLTVWY